MDWSRKLQSSHNINRKNDIGITEEARNMDSVSLVVVAHSDTSMQ